MSYYPSVQTNPISWDLFNPLFFSPSFPLSFWSFEFVTEAFFCAATTGFAAGLFEELPGSARTGNVLGT
jgi:hypothetical protein